MGFSVQSKTIIDPVELANELSQLLQAKNSNGGYVLRKENRLPVLKAEMLLRQLFNNN